MATNLNHLLAGVACGALLLQPSAGAARTPSEKEVAAFLANKPAAAQPLFRSVLVEGDRNYVLNMERAGLAAFELGDDAQAAAAFDAVIAKIDAIYGDSPAADKARSKFAKESSKDFIGEPYERAMAFYYRGLLYLRAGDYDNARASFKGGQRQDAKAAGENFRSDWAVLDVLSGWANHCQGDESGAQTDYQAARAKNPSIALPSKDDHALLVAEIGSGPEKWGDGKYSEELKFRSDKFDEAKVAFLSPAVERSMLAAANAATGARVDAEAAAKAAELAISEKTALATAMRTLSDSMAKELEHNIRASALTSAEAAPAEATLSPVALNTSSKASKTAKAAELAQEKRAEAERQSAAARQAAERLVAERAAVKAALAADSADADIDTAIAFAQTQNKAIAPALAAERSAIGTLQAVGLSPDPKVTLPDGPARKPMFGARGENLFFQASTRGGRPIDHVLAGKASFKEGAAEFSSTSSQSALIAMQTANNLAVQAQSMAAQGYNVDLSGAKGSMYAGAGLMALSMISSMASSAAKPQADIRYWDSLPGEIWFAAAPLEADRNYKALILNEGGRVLQNKAMPLKVDAKQACGIGWVRSRSAVAIPASAPNAVEAK